MIAAAACIIGSSGEGDTPDQTRPVRRQVMTTSIQFLILVSVTGPAFPAINRSPSDGREPDDYGHPRFDWFAVDGTWKIAPAAFNGFDRDPVDFALARRTSNLRVTDRTVGQHQNAKFERKCGDETPQARWQFGPLIDMGGIKPGRELLLNPGRHDAFTCFLVGRDGDLGLGHDYVFGRLKIPIRRCRRYPARREIGGDEVELNFGNPY
jgi:hypothetical protein